jgi:hypothetical protein
MPHPALPPGLPTSVAASSVKQVSSALPPSVAAPESFLIQMASSGSGGLPSSNSVANAATSAGDFLKSAGSSQAGSLGDGIATGYLAPAPALPPKSAIVDGGGTKSIGKLGSQPSEAAPQPTIGIGKSNAVTAGSSRTASTFYSLSGASRSLGNNQETELLQGLDEAIAVDKLPQDLSSPNLSIKTNRLWLDLRAQTDPLNPFILPVPSRPRSVEDDTGPVFSFPNTIPGQKRPETPPPAPTTPKTPQVVELNADRQEYDQERQIFTAEGRVAMRYQGGLLEADRLQVNLTNRIAVAEGNVAFTRGNQVLRGQRLEYNFVQGVGSIQNARGEIFIPELATAFENNLPSDVGAASVLGRPVSDRLTAAQPTRGVTSPRSLAVGFGFGRDINNLPGGLGRGGRVRHLRFEAQQIDFTPNGWTATSLQITNDPYSPPQLVLKADKATLTRLSPTEQEVRGFRPRLVFDQKVVLPIPLTRTLISSGERQPPLVQFGYDDQDRGGLFIQRPFNIIATSQLQFSLTPQIFVQRLILDNKNVGNLDNYGLVGRLSYLVGPLTRIRAFASLTSLDLGKFENTLRASLRATQLIGSHLLNLEYSYRDRLFNGSLGFQTVQSSLGAVLLSPNVILGQTGIVLRYQAGFQYINSDTDRVDLLPTVRTNNRIDLGRFQASASLQKSFYLWQGTTLPATPDAGVRYTPNPVRPYVAVGVSLTGVASYYTSGDNQNNLIGSVALYGQFGHFSRSFFDYTGFSLTYTQLATQGLSPFLFDRTVDNRILIASLTQQLFGPLRLTVQTSINLETNQQISTDYILELSRRAYGIQVRYNPILQLGSITFRLSDFNWSGGTQPFDEVRPVEGGIRRESF